MSGRATSSRPSSGTSRSNWSSWQKTARPVKKERAELVEKNHPQLSVRAQCELLEVPRSSLDYRPVGESEEDRDLMRLMGRDLSDRPVHWHAAAGEGAGARLWPEGQPQAPQEAALGDGAGDDLVSAAQRKRVGQGAPEVSVPAGQRGSEATRPGVVRVSCVVMD